MRADSALHEGTADFKGVSTINARAETIRTSPTWRQPFKKRRYLVAVSGFYVWEKIDTKTRKPYVFNLSDSPLFASAGLWEAWKDKDGRRLQSFSIVTTEANGLLSTVHTRMPCTLHSRYYDRWRFRDTAEPPVDLLQSFHSDQTGMSPANQAVGNVRNNGPEMLNSA